MFQIKKFFYDELYDKLTQGGKASLPVLDPTQSMHSGHILNYLIFDWHLFIDSSNKDCIK